MGRRTLFLALFTILGLGFLSYRVTFALFSSKATSTNNLFAAASVFPSPSFSPSASASPSGSPSGSPSPLPDAFADNVPSLSGTFGHCCSDLSSDINLAKSLVIGAPDSPPDQDFIQISNNTVITLQFVDNKAIDGAGNDIRIHTYDNLFPSSAKIEVSADNSTYLEVIPSVDDTADVDLEIPNSISEVRYVRITDLVTPGEEFPDLGFDIDAMEALNNSAP
jgi:hypothetical protein